MKPLKLYRICKRKRYFGWKNQQLNQMERQYRWQKSQMHSVMAVYRSNSKVKQQQKAFNFIQHSLDEPLNLKRKRKLNTMHSCPFKSRLTFLSNDHSPALVYGIYYTFEMWTALHRFSWHDFMYLSIVQALLVGWSLGLGLQFQTIFRSMFTFFTSLRKYHMSWPLLHCM